MLATTLLIIKLNSNGHYWEVQTSVTFVTTIITPGVFHPPLLIAVFLILKEGITEHGQKIRTRGREWRTESVLTAGVTYEARNWHHSKNWSWLEQYKHVTKALIHSLHPGMFQLRVSLLVWLNINCVFKQDYWAVPHLNRVLVWRYLVCDSSKNHSVGHEGVSIDQSLCLGEVLHRNSKHKLMVEPAHKHTNQSA